MLYYKYRGREIDPTTPNKKMDIFDRNPQRVKAIQTAILEAEYALQQSPEYKRLQLLKEQRKHLPNNQAYSMGHFTEEWSTHGVKKETLTQEQIDAKNKKIAFENEMDWETNEIAYAEFCKLHSLETF